MEESISTREQRLAWMMKYAPLCLAEIEKDGRILQLNIQGEMILKPVMAAHGLPEDNIYPVLQLIAPGVLDKIRNFSEKEGLIVHNQLVHYTASADGNEKFFNITSSKLPDGTIIVSIDDVTEVQLKERDMREAIMDRSLAQGKYEIASDVLHDIGNAIVGMGSYLTRIRRSMEQNQSDNLRNLVTFFIAQQAALAGVMGEAKAAAVVTMLANIAEVQKTQREEVGQSVAEQTHIISHIQEILHIQRQYVNGQESERKPVSLRGIVNDCLSMQLASMEKRGISISREIPDDIPSVKGDRTKLMQVVLNILKNSIEAIDMGAAEKNICIRMTKTDGVLVLQLRDNGCGFDEATGQRLFSRGFTTKSSGTGLGLHHCRAIIESHGGTIGIASEGPGKGALTTVTFNLS